MRFIDKQNPCQEFDNFIINSDLNEYLDKFINDNNIKFHPWDKFVENAEGSEIKKTLTTHLFNEQKGLCIYCEQSLNPNNKILSNYAHLEHIKPKERNKFPQHTFDYHNLTVSCNGFDCSKYSNKKQFCGHKKSSQFKEKTFLDPTKLKDIDKYFDFTIEGNIKPAKNLELDEQQKAEDMIKLLDLRNSVLVEMRANSYSSFIEFNDDEIESLLNSKNEFYPGFYSMLIQFFIN